MAGICFHPPFSIHFFVCEKKERGDRADVHTKTFSLLESTHDFRIASILAEHNDDSLKENNMVHGIIVQKKILQITCETRIFCRGTTHLNRDASKAVMHKNYKATLG